MYVEICFKKFPLKVLNRALSSRYIQEVMNIMENFCKNTSIPGCRYLLKKSKLERAFWVLCFATGIVCIAYIAINIAHEWSEESVYVTLDASSRPITRVDFPGVAICDINKISRHRAIQLATKLLNFTANKKLKETLSFVRILGNFFDNNVYGSSSFAYIQNILNMFDNGTTDRDLILRLASLITPCSDLLLNCSWNSASYKCVDLFQTKLTDSGFCCVFNYMRNSSEAIILSGTNTVVPKNVRTFVGTGVAKGLSVTINNNISDYFYTSMATRGSLIKIFLPGDFPDLSSGSLRQIIVQERSEVFVNVEANTLITMDEVKFLTKKQRKCSFPYEEKTAFGSYTSSNCFVSCKLHSIVALCNCIPFSLPAAETNNYGVGICNLVDIPCLSRYQGKWLRYFPSEAINVEELSLDIEDSLVCDNCWPNCYDVTYAIDTNYFEFFSEDPLYSNSSRVHIYSDKAYTNSYRKTVSSTWYESLSTFGGIVSILLGISLINFVEIGVLILKLVLRKLANMCNL